MPSHDARLNLYVQTESDTPDFVNGLVNRDGRNLLREESCGAERNALGGDLDPADGMLFRNDNFVRVPILAGSKAVRLEPGATLSGIASVQGHIVLRLPTATKSYRIEAPFQSQTVSAPELRVVLGDSADGTIKYDISGRTDRLLAARALNAGDPV